MISYIFVIEGRDSFKITGRNLHVVSGRCLFQAVKPKKGDLVYFCRAPRNIPRFNGKCEEFARVVEGVEEYQVGGGIPCGLGFTFDPDLTQGDLVVGLNVVGA